MKYTLAVLAACGLVMLASAQVPGSSTPAILQGPTGVPPPDNETRFQSFLRQREAFDPSVFQFTFQPVADHGPGGNLRQNQLSQNAALLGYSVGQNLVTVDACAVNQPHTHQRGTEISHMTEGELLFGFIEENGGRVILANMTRSQSIFIPTGLTHFAQNLGCARGQFIASFPAEDPGTQTQLSAIFRLPDTTLAATTGLSYDTIRTARGSILAQNNPSRGDPACLQACGISASFPGSPMASDILPASGAPGPAGAPSYAFTNNNLGRKLMNGDAEPAQKPQNTWDGGLSRDDLTWIHGAPRVNVDAHMV